LLVVKHQANARQNATQIATQKDSDYKCEGRPARQRDRRKDLIEVTAESEAARADRRAFIVKYRHDLHALMAASPGNHQSIGKR
jgi:hypothetical protein